MLPQRRLSRPLVVRLLLLFLLLLLLGTQMPNDWRNGLERSLHAPFGVSSLAHFCIFATMAALTRVAPLRWPIGRILLSALALGLFTEGMQFFAVDRHPGLDDVAIDMAGAALGVWLARLADKPDRR